MRLRDKVALAALGMTLLCTAIIIVFTAGSKPSVNALEALSPLNNRLMFLPALALLVGYVGDYLSS